MPSKEKKENNFYIEFEDGEHIALGDTINMIDIYQESYISRELPIALSLEISGEGVADVVRALKRKILCNNWRKMHNMPMIRKQKLTQ